MKVLALSLDRSLLDPHSRAAQRVAGYSVVTDAYHIIVPDHKHTTVNLADNIKVWSSAGGGKAAQLWGTWAQARNLIKGVHYNLISVQDYYYLGFLAYLISVIYGLPLEVQVHGFEKYSGLRKIIANFVIKRADGIRTVSERLKRQLIKEFKVDPARVAVIMLGASLPKELPAATPTANTFTFITVARLVKVKRIDLAIAAFAQLVKEYPYIKFKIVGDGPERLALVSQVKTLGVDDKVEFIDWTADVYTHLGQANVFVLSSESEGWGMSVVEAAYAGLPVIMTDVGCAGEFVLPEVSGLVVSVGSIDGLCGAMRRLMTDELLYTRLQEGAKLVVASLPSEHQLRYMHLAAWQKIARP